MHDPHQAELEKNCKELSGAFKDILSWTWDDRFDTVLAEFSVNNKDVVRTILDQYLNNVWDNSNIGRAPDTVKKINIDLGKLRPGQLLFTSDLNQEAFLFCAWWPWGNGKTISIRIAPSYNNLSDSDKTGKSRQLKSWFGI